MVYIVFGVSGSGKTTIGKLLSQELNLPFFDADDFHPEANILKMEEGLPLNDKDREPWLNLLKSEIDLWNRDGGAILACSALKKSYRKLLSENNEVKWIWLYAPYQVIEKRLFNRHNHFFDSKLLKSQFETLEKPEKGIWVSAEHKKQDVLSALLNKIKASSFGVLGLGVMGKSLALNIARKSNSISVFNREVPGKEEDIALDFVKEHKDLAIRGYNNLNSFIDSLERPRKILIMVNAGKPVDIVINDLIPLLDEGDIVIDGGNSHYKKTKKRYELLKSYQIHFIGMGVSGGEKGALNGPSMMPSGEFVAYSKVSDILESISAKDKNEIACCSFIGPEGSGHFVKMIHNGIEYAEMQLIAEVYYALRYLAEVNQEEIANIFESWKNDDLNSYLLEITIDILRKKEGEEYLLDVILDQASQKGTGGWSTNTALELGKPLNTIADAVFARYISAMKDIRIEMDAKYSDIRHYECSIDTNQLKDAYKFSRIVNHAIGFDVIEQASKEYDWNLNLSDIARIWTNGCIIRSDLMETLVHWLKSNNHLFMNDECSFILKDTFSNAKINLSNAILNGCPMTVHSSALNYFLMMTNAQSSANMIQAQRDYFGAHTYQRIDRSKANFYHTKW
ncbi:hypothetical protein KH5_18200 [Urechidicola sp. KH5]